MPNEQPRAKSEGDQKNLSGRSPDEMQWNPGELRPRPQNPGFRCATSGLRHYWSQI